MDIFPKPIALPNVTWFELLKLYWKGHEKLLLIMFKNLKSAYCFQCCKLLKGIDKQSIFYSNGKESSLPCQQVLKHLHWARINEANVLWKSMFWQDWLVFPLDPQLYCNMDFYFQLFFLVFTIFDQVIIMYIFLNSLWGPTIWDKKVIFSQIC